MDLTFTGIQVKRRKLSAFSSVASGVNLLRQARGHLHSPLLRLRAGLSIGERRPLRSPRGLVRAPPLSRSFERRPQWLLETSLARALTRRRPRILAFTQRRTPKGSEDIAPKAGPSLRGLRVLLTTRSEDCNPSPKGLLVLISKHAELPLLGRFREGHLLGGRALRATERDRKCEAPGDEEPYQQADDQRHQDSAQHHHPQLQTARKSLALLSRSGFQSSFVGQTLIFNLFFLKLKLPGVRLWHWHC